MLASNPVDPSQVIKIQMQGPAGPSVAYPRSDERGATSSLGLLAAAALLTIGYVIGGFASASAPAVTAGEAPQPVDIGGGAAGQPGGPMTTSGESVARPVTGEFRLGLGNAAPYVVEPATVAAPVPGELRLAPGNAAPTVVAPIRVSGPLPGEFRLGPGNSQPSGPATR